MVCPRCGAASDSAAKFCPRCGVALVSPRAKGASQTVSINSNVTAGTQQSGPSTTVTETSTVLVQDEMPAEASIREFAATARRLSIIGFLILPPLGVVGLVYAQKAKKNGEKFVVATVFGVICAVQTLALVIIFTNALVPRG